jgi:hypothetical protein
MNKYYRWSGYLGDVFLQDLLPKTKKQIFIDYRKQGIEAKYIAKNQKFALYDLSKRYNLMSNNN